MEEIIARGNGNYIRGYAAKVAHQNGYKSMWLFSGQPILLADRRYLLWQDEDGFLTVSREA